MGRSMSGPRIVAWTYHADIYCDECAGGLPGTDPEGNAKHVVFDGQDAADSPQHCGDCRDILDIQLTEDGCAYVLEALDGYVATLSGDPAVLDAWRDCLCSTLDVDGERTVARYEGFRQACVLLKSSGAIDYDASRDTHSIGW